MSTKRHKPKQIVNLLRQIEVANEKVTPQACRHVGITARTYYRWRRESGGLKVHHAKRLKERDEENLRVEAVGGGAISGEECLNGEVFYLLREAQVVIEQWRVEYSTRPSHSALGYRPPVPAAYRPLVTPRPVPQPRAVM